MAIGRISGGVLKSNLTRNGVDLAFETNLLYLDVTNNRIGIGTSEPTTTFHVNGTIRGSSINVNNAYTLPTSDGSAGQQLTTDGSGTVTWADVDGSSDISITGNEIKTTTSNSTLDLKANGTGDINLTAGADVNIPANIGLTFGDDGEKIEGDGTNLTIASSNDVTIDAAGDIFLDAAGNEVKILNAGTELARFVNNSRNFQIKNPNQDKDIIIQGNDGGSNVDALTLDMSEAGKATFNSTIAATGLTINSAYTLPTADGTANQVLKTDGSGVLTFANDSSTLDHTAISDDTTASLMQKIGISTTEKTVESNPVGTYDSALYYITSRNEIDDRVAVQKVSVVHNNTTAYASTTHITRTVEGTGQTFTADIDSGAVRLRATGSSDSNSVTAYKIPLGDFSSVGTSGNTAVVINADLDSGTEALDTWAHASYRGAKYFISVNNATDIELESIECIVVHNGTEAYITSYNSVTTNNSLITLTATISGTDVELRGAGATANLNVKMHRILLSDSESLSEAVNQKTLPATTVSSTATTIDSFDASSIHGAFYYVVGTNSAEGNASSITELAVVTDGTDAYVSTGPMLSTKGTDQLSFTATTSGSTISIQASSTSGGSTTVNAYRINMKRDENVASANVVLKEGTQTITGAKTFSAPIVLNTTTTDDSLTITTTEASNSAAPVISLKRNSSSPADADYLGQIKFKGENDADQEVNYAKISGKILDASDGSEDGILEFAFAKAGSQNISARFRSDSLQLLNETSFRVAQGHAEFGVLASDPGGSAGYAKIYSKDESSSAEMFVQDEAGNVTKISPHNEEGEWEYYSRNTKTGKTVRVNMEEMIRDIEKLTGKSYIKNN